MLEILPLFVSIVLDTFSCLFCWHNWHKPTLCTKFIISIILNLMFYATTVLKYVQHGLHTKNSTRLLYQSISIFTGFSVNIVRNCHCYFLQLLYVHNIIIIITLIWQNSNHYVKRPITSLQACLDSSYFQGITSLRLLME